MKLSGCIESLFEREYPAVEDRIRPSAEAGLDAVEFWLWHDKDLNKIERALDDTGVGLTLFSSEPRSPIVDPASHRAFLDGLRESVKVARRLNASALCVLADDRGVGGGTEPRTDRTRAEQHAAVVEVLKQAAPMAADEGLKLLVEPLNTMLDHKGYFLDSTPEGLDIIEEVAHPAVLLLFDIYHSTMMGEGTAEVLGKRGHLVGHVHAADVPGRHEPGSGTIDWPATMAILDALGYAGAIGLEYWPTGSTIESLSVTRKSLGAAARAD